MRPRLAATLCLLVLSTCLLVPVDAAAATPSAATSHQLTAAATKTNCHGTATAYRHAWTGPYNTGCGYIGTNKSVRKTYNWYVPDWAPFNGTVCVQVLGHVAGKPRWYGIGCGEQGTASVPWGYVMGQPQVKLYKQTGIAVPVYFE